MCPFEYALKNIDSCLGVTYRLAFVVLRFEGCPMCHREFREINLLPNVEELECLVDLQPLADDPVLLFEGVEYRIEFAAC